ncbi:cytochrome P450, partial [Flagelloscypha sp. PMI_526]
SLLLGPTFHLSIHLLTLNVEGWPWTTLILTILSFFAFLPFETALLSFGCFNVGLWSSILLYRLVLHPLRNFPGPKAARVSAWWSVRRTLKSGFRQYKEVQGIHGMWGDFSFLGPRELSINNAAAIPLLYGPQSKCMKGPWYAMSSTNSADCSVHLTQDVEDHRLRRRAWDRGFSVSALNTFTPRIISKTNSLISQLKTQTMDGTQSKVLDLNKWIIFFAFDVMGDIGLGKDLRSIETGVGHPVLLGLHETLKYIGLLGYVPWFMRMLVVTMSYLSGYNAFLDYSKSQLIKKEEVNRSSQPTDILSWLLKAKYDNDKTAALGQLAMHADASVIIVAGSDTTASSLSNTFYHLAMNKDILTKLRNHLLPAFPNPTSEDWSYDVLRNIPYLDWVINETLRLHPPVPSGLGRVTPKDGLTVGNTWIPGGAVVSVPTYTIQRDERYWPDEPEEFKPERWQGLNPDTKDAFIPFGRGPWGCVGKTLSKMEMRMVIARVVLNFDLVIDPNEEKGVRLFEENQKEWFTLMNPPLLLKLVPL